MGCTGNTGLDNIDENHKLDILPISHKLNKNEKIDLSENTNKYIMNCSKYYDEKITDNNDSGSKFIDKKFPSENFSPETEELLQIDNSNIEWKSIKEIFGKKVKIFGDTTSIKDIKLGPADNSYFVSAISSLSEFPNIIVQLFRTVFLPKEGEPIEVCIRIEGKLTVVYLDDKFMVNKNNNIPIFSTSPTKNIWGMILEKAWAKVCGGYENIMNGTCSEIFEAFTPFRIIEIDIRKFEIEAFLDYVNSSFEHNCMMTCTTKDDLIDYESLGFFSGYSFSLFEHKEDLNNNEIEKKNVIRNIKIRNPIGDNKAFKNSVNKELMENIGIESFQEDGLFLMDYMNFMKIFSSITICIPTSVLKSYLIEIPKENANDFGTIRILIEEESNLSISIISLSYRFHENIIPDNDIFKNLILIQIFRNKQKATYISSSFNESLFTSIKPGEYICIYNIDYKITEVKELQPFNIIISSTSNFKYSLDEPDNELQLLKHIMIPKVEALPKYEKILKDDYVLFTGNRFELTSFGFYYMKNRQKETKYVKPSVYLKNFKSIEGEFPISLKMDKNSTFFFLFNRVKLKSTYQTGANVGFFKKEVPDALEPISYEKMPEKYCREIEYKEKKCDYEFSSLEQNN